ALGLHALLLPGLRSGADAVIPAESFNIHLLGTVHAKPALAAMLPILAKPEHQELRESYVQNLAIAAAYSDAPSPFSSEKEFDAFINTVKKSDHSYMLAYYWGSFTPSERTKMRRLCLASIATQLAYRDELLEKAAFSAAL